MQTNTKLLNEMIKGATIDGETVMGVLTMSMLTRRGTKPMLVQDANAEEGRLVWTKEALYAYLPLANNMPYAWMRFDRGEVAMLKGGMKAFIEAAKLFGDKTHQQVLGSVEKFVVDGKPYDFCDIGRGGTDSGEEDNEGKVANGRSLALRFLHLTTAEKAEENALKGATHILYTGAEDAENIFGSDGDVTPNVWVNGAVFDPNDLKLEE